MDQTHLDPSNIVTTSVKKSRETPPSKYKLRAVFRTVAFLTLVSGYALFNFLNFETEEENPRRRLQDDSSGFSLFMDKAEPGWLLIPHIFGVLYMFFALSIVCDEYFVPALEVMSGDYHLNLTPDISGATLMAAGGSAPELFTSFIGTFQQSEVGFGTIVGSAVFNVLFVIGMCSLLSKEVLEVTWWPLFRDSTYYAIGLVVLAVFVGMRGPGEVDTMEAAILFAMYLGYILLMAFNERLYSLLTGGKSLYQDEEPDDVLPSDTVMNFKRPTTFRAGLLTLIRQPDVWIDKARISFVSKISGSVDDVFDFVDSNGDGTITAEEMKMFFDKLENKKDFMSDDEVEVIMNDIDTNKNGSVSKPEFKEWYIKSESNVKSQLKKVFNQYDTDNSNSIQPYEFQAMLKKIEPQAIPSEYEQALQTCFSNGKNNLSFDEFTEWYFQSTWYTQHKKGAEDHEGKTIRENLVPPKGAGVVGFLKYIILLPIVGTLTLTVFDTRRPGMQRGPYCYFSFLMSIAWIGVYSYFMVGWAETIGNTLGIDTFLMGLTFLAAGTSIPDLLSSVIVARMGEGDMAVSSSIGSNIFDILVGLPVPWFFFTIWPTTPSLVTIGAEGVWVSIMILLGMLVLIITTIFLSGWKLTKMLGFTMFFFYFLFVLQEVIRYVMG